MRKFTLFVLKKIHNIAAITGTILIIYFMVRAGFIVFANYSLVERLFGGFLFIGETYILIHTFGFILSVFEIKEEYKIKEPDNYDLAEYPFVAVIVAARHEPKQVLQETFITIRNLKYPKKNIYLLDDSSEKKFIDEADEIAKKLGVTVFRRAERHGAKAGIVNDFIRQMDEKYIAVFDADQNPMPGFLTKTVYYLEQDDKLAFVQTPQFYTNLYAGPIAKAATIQQAIFYEVICEGKSINNAMFCCGTNVVFRKSALDKVGGFDEKNITEDFATSVKLHANGYKSLYLNHVSAFGMAPESLPEYFKQQNRWASGTISVFRSLLQMFIRNPFCLSPIQWWEYFLAGTYYFIGWGFFLLMISPISFLLFSIPSYFIKPAFYIGVFLPYFVLSLGIFYTVMMRRNYRFREIYIGTIMGMLSFPVLMKAAVFGLINKRMTFVVTAKGKADNMPFFRLWPYHVMIVLNISAVAYGINRIYFGEDPYALSVNIFWALYHLFILSHIYFLNRTPKAKLIYEQV
ncbi:glycosyltransferase [Candidatus Latescibacterota bacterium]